MSTDERLARWSRPLTTPPADVRLSPAVEAIRTEIAKLESPTGGTIDWAEVLRLGDAFLAETGRDLVVASAVASALAHREGVAGAALGARLLASLLADVAASPPRPRARANAVVAFATRAELIIGESKHSSRELLQDLDLALAALETAASSTLGPEAPTLRGARDRTRSALDALPAPTPPPAPTAPIFAPPPPLPSTSSVTGADVPDRIEQVAPFVRRTCAQLVAASALARASSPLDPDALRLTLVALYLPITSAPEVTRDTRTALPAPAKLVLESLARQSSSALPELVARECLAALERSRFALDVHVHLSRALDRAGAAAASAIHRHEVRGLIARLPALLDREFSDGTPFASTEARALFTTSEPREPSASTNEESRAQPIDDVRSMARAGRIGEALALGARIRQTASSGRERFEATLAMAGIAEQAHAVPLAHELHATLLAEMDRHGLDAWEPALAVSVLRAAVRAQPRAEAEAARALFSRLARLDAQAAFEISPTLHATPAKPGR